MKALLLAAGFGTRLRPLTDVLPKCLAPIGERPLLEYWLVNLFDAGFSEVVINTHYFQELVISYLEGTPWSTRVTLAPEHELLGTAGTILQHRKFFGNEAFLVAHADNLSLFDPATLIYRHSHRPTGTVMTMMTFESLNPQSCGIVSLNNKEIVTEFFEKVPNPPSKVANAAVYILESEVVDLIAKLPSPHSDLSTDVIPQLMGKIFTYHNNEFHMDIGTIGTWLEAQTTYPLLRKKSDSSSDDSWSKILDRDNQKIRRVVDKLRK